MNSSGLRPLLLYFPKYLRYGEGRRVEDCKPMVRGIVCSSICKLPYARSGIQ